ncbi:MAG TPA: protein kinase [Gemmataceae bacterium]|nr:protein kinase [Gemmataceae bacterium]
MSVSAFEGTPRFQILNRLGAGGMGVVYQAFDRERQVRVALKALSRLDASSLYLFKQEFRALADVVHPNLATLHELIEYQGTWFFTMEIVDGIDFLRYVRGAPGAQPTTLRENDTTSTLVVDSIGTKPFYSSSGDDTPYDGAPDRLADPPRSAPLVDNNQFERLRGALTELTEGLLALHGAGKLHRDIKPSNVLVTSAGRVVLLDFGLVQDVGSFESSTHEEGEIAGTLAYMAPEQAAGKALTPAGDWYAVGVILFQALTGRLPFETRGLRLMADKQRYDAPAVSGLSPIAPPDLAQLCQMLLQRSPVARPSGSHVRDQLRGIAPTPVAPAPAAEQTASTVFIGRQAQLARLRQAADLGRSQTVVVYVHGRSGVGKSWLMQHFLEELTADDDEVVLLAGRCYERESVPYKALDGLMDALSRYLRSLPPEETLLLISPDVGILARLFPVLRRVSAIASMEKGAEIADQHELRRRAFAGLRDLLTRLGSSKRLILHIDDLQWGDLDSAALLTELLAPAAAPRLCLFCSYREEYAESSACLRALLESASPSRADFARHDLPIEPLDMAEAEQLALALLSEGDDRNLQAEAEAIARESEGGPYFIRELVHYLRQGRRQAGAKDGKITLDQVLWERVCALPAPARRLLEIVAVAGKPIRQRNAYQAAELAGDDVAALRRLHAAHLIRGTGAGAQDEVEIYHDRIREIVNRRMSASALVGCHGRLAKIQEAAGDADPETLAFHFLGSGDPEKAGHYYHQAAVQAAGTLAFERAARLYRQSLATWPLHGQAAREVYAGLAKSLADAGRPPEAGDAFCAAAKVAEGRQALEFRVEAARHFLLSGHLERGLEELRPALRAVGLRYPRSKFHAVLSLVWRSLLLRRHSLRSSSRAAIPVSELLRLDVCIMAAGSLGYYGFLRSLDFSLRAAQMALATGEPERLVEALVVLAMFEAAGGGTSRRRTDRLIDAAQEACATQPSPYLQGLMACVRAETAYFCGEYREGLSHATRAEEIFRERCTGRVHNLAFSRTYILLSRLFLGDIAELARLAPALVADAQVRGDVSFVAMHRAFVLPILHLADDDPEKAGAMVKQALIDWGGRESHMIQTLALLGGISTSLYAGRIEEAWRSVGGQWQRWKLSPNILVQSARIEMHSLRARCALAAHALTPGKSLLRMAQRSAQKLEAERMPRCEPLAGLIRAAVTFQTGNRTESIALLERAQLAFEREAMSLHAAAARRRLGQLLVDGRGRAMIQEAVAWMTSQGIKNPGRMTKLMAPGFET